MGGLVIGSLGWQELLIVLVLLGFGIGLVVVVLTLASIRSLLRPRPRGPWDPRDPRNRPGGGA